MNRIAICTKCGLISDTDVYSAPKKKCWQCSSVGTFVLLDMSYEEVEEKYKPELLPKCKKMALEKYGNENIYLYSWLRDMTDEKIRENYFYGKLDRNVDPYEVNKRIEDTKYRYTEAYNEEYRRNKTAVRALKNNMFYKYECPSCGSNNISMKPTIKGFLQIYFHRAGYNGFNKKYICNDCGKRFS